MSAKIDQMKLQWAVSAAKESWRIHTIQATEITPRAIEWAWPGWLALGKLTILAGAGGSGKTTLAISIAAILTNGGPWPDGESCEESRSVLIWSSEDDPSDTIVPRLIAAGADRGKVYILQGCVNGLEDIQAFDPAQDLDLLAAELERIGDVGLIIIDPIVSAVAGDMHRANVVRRALQGFVDLAEKYNCAVLGITHFSKGSTGNNPAERVLGSQAFGALARAVWVAAKQENSDLRVLARAKSNIGTDDGGYFYGIEECVVGDGINTTCVVWGKKIQGSAGDILAQMEYCDNGGCSEKEDAKEFLIGLLANGPVSTKQVKEDAAGAGHSWRTVERAKKALGIEAFKEGLKAGWFWRLATEDRQSSLKTATNNTGGLQEEVAAFCE